MHITFAFWISLVGTSIAALLVYLVLRAGIRKPGNFAAFIMFLGVFVWSLGEFIERVAGPPPQDQLLAYIGMLTLCGGVFLTPAGLIHFALDYPYRLKMGNTLRKAILYTIYAISIIGLAIIPFNSLLNDIVIHQISYTALGVTLWGLHSGPIHAFFTAWTFVAALTMIFILALKLRGLEMKLVRNQILITIVGFLIMFILIVYTYVIPAMMNQDTYPLTTLSFSIFGLFVIYTIMKYRMFLVAPSVEEKVEDVELPEEGIHEMEKEEAYHKFELLAKSAHTCLAFIPDEPEAFKEKYGLKNTPVFQFTRELGKDRLNPELAEHRDMLVFIITSMVEQVYKPVIMIDLSAEWIGERIREKIIDKIKGLLREDYGGVYFIIK